MPASPWPVKLAGLVWDGTQEGGVLKITWTIRSGDKFEHSGFIFLLTHYNEPKRGACRSAWEQREFKKML